MVLTSHLTIYEIAGIVGVLLHLIPYAVLQMGLISGRGYLYPAVKIAAALCVMASLGQHFNGSSMLIQVSFLVISLVGIGRLFYGEKLRRYSVEEKAFIQNALPEIDMELAAEIVKMGTWSEASAGTVLAREGKMVRDLVYILDGEADVSLNGIKITTLPKERLCGEFTCMEGAPATATVVLNRPSRIMRLNATKLRIKAKSFPDLKCQLEHIIRSEMVQKFANLNDRAFLDKSLEAEA